MPVNRNALIRYQGITTGVSRRTIQADMEMMRRNKLSYKAPIVVVDKKYYTYADKNYSITNIPLNQQDLQVLTEVSGLLKQFKLERELLGFGAKMRVLSPRILVKQLKEQFWKALEGYKKASEEEPEEFGNRTQDQQDDERKRNNQYQ